MKFNSIIILVYLINSGLTYGQTSANQVDTLGADSSEDKDILYDERNVTCNTFYKWPHRYATRCYYSDGQKRRRGTSSFFKVVRSKTWDKQGRLIRKSRQYPFGSTSYRYVSREKTYNQQGRLIKYVYVKEDVACFGGGIIRQKIIEYGDNGKVKSRTIKRRKDFKVACVFE